MLPTFCELAGATPPSEIDGISIVPTLLGDAGKQRRHKYLYWEFHERGKAQAVRMGSWKGVRRNLAKNPGAPLELYHLGRDRAEESNLAKDHPKIVSTMLEAIAEAHVESQLFPFLPND
jgi:arylsulfatase A-like enzyme